MIVKTIKYRAKSRNDKLRRNKTDKTKNKDQEFDYINNKKT